jgi:AraC-like DNA-binding protein
MQSRLDWINDWELRAQDCGYSASKLAQSAGVTLRLLEIFFQERFGMTPHVWMVRVRMIQAMGLLRVGKPVRIVSGKVGYKQVSHFSREFKRYFGVSPVRYVITHVKNATAEPTHFAFR